MCFSFLPLTGAYCKFVPSNGIDTALPGPLNKGQGLQAPVPFCYPCKAALINTIFSLIPFGRYTICHG